LGASERENLAAPPGNQGSSPALHCHIDLRVGKAIVRAKDAWERALDCAVRAQQTDNERTYTAFTKLRNSWIRVANNLEFIDFIPADHGSPKRALAPYRVSTLLTPRQNGDQSG